MEKWKIIAIQEGRICPECKVPVAKWQWKQMNIKGDVRHCLSCRYAHWEIPLYESRGNVYDDNADRDALISLRTED